MVINLMDPRGVTIAIDVVSSIEPQWAIIPENTIKGVRLINAKLTFIPKIDMKRAALVNGDVFMDHAKSMLQEILPKHIISRTMAEHSKEIGWLYGAMTTYLTGGDEISNNPIVLKEILPKLPAIGMTFADNFDYKDTDSMLPVDIFRKVIVIDEMKSHDFLKKVMSQIGFYPYVSPKMYAKELSDVKSAVTSNLNFWLYDSQKQVEDRKSRNLCLTIIMLSMIMLIVVTVIFVLVRYH